LAGKAADGDGRLRALLEARGVRRDPNEVLAIVEGMLAAPRGYRPDAWLDLIAPPEAAELRAHLLTLRDEIARGSAQDEPPVAERLARLRRELARQGVQGLILPLTDEHRSEYMPAASRRLTWLTGFTGSAGLCIVLPERAAVFVDGRYTLQAKGELDPNLFEPRHVTEEPPVDWIRDHLRAGDRLAYDPNLHVRSEIERYRGGAERAGGELVALEANPVDAVWETRPSAPIAPVEVLPLAYAGETSADKRARMGERVAGTGAEVAVIPATDSIAWLLNIRGGDVPYNPLVLSFALLHADGTVQLFVDPRKLKPGQNLGNGVAIQPIEGFGDALSRLGREGRAVMVDPSVVSVGVAERLRAAGARLIEGDEPCRLAKATKNEVELEGARAAQIRDGAAVCRFLRWLEIETARRRVSELEAVARLDGERARDPLFRGPSFPTISGAGPNGAIVHYRVTEESDRALERGSLYLVDSGGQYLDATTDITRTVAIGEPDAKMRRHFTLVLKGHIAIARAVFPQGTTGGQLDTLARLALWQAGLDYDHGTGHGVGAYLCVHEGPARISKTGSGPALQPGMILSNEPGYYRGGAYGIRTENLVAVRARGRPEGGERDLLEFETLTRAPIDRRLIEPELLDADERAWLDGYHARVRADLEGLLDPDTTSWLVSATRAIG
jgi:Xaa-Pro aminopeptidase